MRSFPSTLALAGAGALLLVLQAATGCGAAEGIAGGDEFKGLGGQGEAGEGGAGAITSGSGGTDGNVSGSGGAGGGVLLGCRGPEDCSDGDPCTQDACRADGFCFLSPKCALGEKCCEGDCGECCDDADCDDGIACTADVCFAGGCQHLPDDKACSPGEYCSLVGDCMAKEPCSPNAPEVCDDGSACTADTCTDELCLHHFCDAAMLCCPSTGCAAECCTDKDCDTDSDACTVGVCNMGQCSQAPRCADGEQCCATAEGATCGSCCSADECDDGIDCTVDGCVEGKCYNPAGSCSSGYTCDPQTGCVKNIECKADADCTAGGCGHCSADGKCSYGCGVGQQCCDNQCQQCCGNADCFDGIDCTDNACVGGACKFTPNNKHCPLLQRCVAARRGCVLL